MVRLDPEDPSSLRAALQEVLDYKGRRLDVRAVRQAQMTDIDAELAAGRAEALRDASRRVSRKTAGGVSTGADSLEVAILREQRAQAETQLYGQGNRARFEEDFEPDLRRQIDSSLAALAPFVEDEALERHQSEIEAFFDTFDVGVVLDTMRMPEGSMDLNELFQYGSRAATSDPLETVAVEEVAALLPEQSALVEFVVVPDEAAPLQPQYGAFVLRPSSEIQFTRLGQRAHVDSLVTAVREHLARFDPERLGARQQAVDALRLQLLLQELYAQLVAPLDLSDARQLMLSLEGALAVLPFEMLMSPDETYLIDRFGISYVSSGRDLLRFRTVEPEGGFYVFANPDFDDGASTGTPVPPDADESSGGTSASALAGGPYGMHFDPLPGTTTEAALLADLFALERSHLFLGSRATEANLASIQAPWRLHLATHGFFLGEPVRADAAPFSGRESADAVPEDDLLLRSGLALSGANWIGESSKGFNEPYDGLVTAYEIAHLDLRSTDLVVLSACETGAGAIRDSEGVFGLRSAFEQAGAQTVVMSLWAVSDDAARDLFTAFYEALRGGTSKAEALRQAMLGLKSQDPYAHPYYWAAFVLAGNPN